MFFLMSNKLFKFYSFNLGAEQQNGNLDDSSPNENESEVNKEGDNTFKWTPTE